MSDSLHLPISDPGQAGEARRKASSWARERGCNLDEVANVALVVTELAQNLTIHTTGGVLLLRDISVGKNLGIEILSLDQGPGIADLNQCLRDGHSTAGTSGIGLGAVKRASHVFEVHSQVGIGTALLSELWAKRATLPQQKFNCGAVNVPLTGEAVCGDSWAVQEEASGRVRVLVADGLGHGDQASVASRKAVEVFGAGSCLSLVSLFERMHIALKGTRGAAVSVAEIDPSAGEVSYLGIGNIAASIVIEGKSAGLVSHNGTIGVQYRNLQKFSYKWTADALLIMHSDGIKTQWQLERYLGISRRHPAIIAGVLYRDYQRENDDSTIVVLRERPTGNRV